ncbi:MAG: putative Serine/threonine protein phosphatase [Caulobacteraceae bacterium]|nr:MAG: putative Serine/threonine protein phosphatase [Caulobacteraceae bacterium]
MRSRARLIAGAAAGALLAVLCIASPQSAAAQAIESGSLAELDPWAVGAIAREQALQRDIWGQSDPSTLSLLFDRLTPNIGSPAGARMARQALLSPATAPAGDTIVAARKRYEALARLGLADEIVSMVSGSGEAKRDPGIVLYATQADLARGRLNDACRRAATIETDAPPPFVLRLRALCAAAAGEKDAADLAMEVARASGANDPWFATVIATLTGAPPARAAVARYDTSLNASASLTAKLRAPPQNALLNASAFALAMVARDENAVPALRAQAAAKAFRQGTITPMVARAAARGEAGQRTAGQLSIVVGEAEAAANPYAQVIAIEGALKRAKPHGEFVAMARLFASEIASAPTDPGAAIAATTFTRAALATGDYATAQRWRQAADSVASSPNLLSILDVALAMSRDDAASAHFVADRRIELAGPAGARLASRDLQALATLGLPIGQAAEDFVRRTPAAVGRKPDPALMAQLVAAATRRAAGEVAIHAALALGGGAEELDTADLLIILAALREVGLGDAARAVAIEAVIGGQAR